MAKFYFEHCLTRVFFVTLSGSLNLGSKLNCVFWQTTDTQKQQVYTVGKCGTFTNKYELNMNMKKKVPRISTI